VSSSHVCAAGPACVRRDRMSINADDGHGDGQSVQPVLCDTCLTDHVRATLFCTAPCAGRYFATHWQQKHGMPVVGRGAVGHQSVSGGHSHGQRHGDLLAGQVTLEDVVRRTFTKVNPGLTYSWHR